MAPRRSRDESDERLMGDPAEVDDSTGRPLVGLPPEEDDGAEEEPDAEPEMTPEQVKQMVADAQAEAAADAALRKAESQAAKPAAVGAATLPTPAVHRPHASKVDSALRGGLQGATGGWSDEAAAWLGSKFPSLEHEPYELIARWMEEQEHPGLNRPLEARPYEVIRDELRGLNAGAREDNPKTYVGSEILGDLAVSSRLPGGRMSNALQSFAAGAGGSEAEDPLEWAAEGVATAAGGDVLQKVLGLGRRGASALARRLPEDLKRTAEQSAVKATGAIKTHFKKMGSKRSRELGREMLDDKLVPWGASKATILEGAEKQLETSGSTIGAILETADEVTGNGFDWPQARLRLLAKAEKLDPVEEDLVRRSILNMDDQFRRAQERGLGFADANKMKSSLGKTLNWVTDPKLKMELQRQLYTLFNEEIEQQLGDAFAKAAVPSVASAAARRVGVPEPAPFVNLSKQDAIGPSTRGDELARRSAMTGPETGAPRVDAPFDEAGMMQRRQISDEAKADAIRQFKEQKRLYGTAREVEDLADKEGLAAEVGNRFTSPSDYFAIGAGLTGGTAGILSTRGKPGEENPWAEGLGLASLGSLGLGLGHKYLRQRGRAMVAKPADALSKASQWSVNTYDKAAAAAAPFMAKHAPDLLGKFGPLLAREYQRGGDDGVRALDMAMSDDPEYTAARDAAMKQLAQSDNELVQRELEVIRARPWQPELEAERERQMGRSPVPNIRPGRLLR